MHGPTFMGNAIACSVALKSVELFENENYMDKIEKIEAITRREMSGLKDDRIADVRMMGGCVCVEVKDPKTLEATRNTPTPAASSPAPSSTTSTPWSPTSSPRPNCYKSSTP